MKIKHLKYIISLSLTSLVACSQAGNSDDTAHLSSEPVDFQQQIQATIADKSCNSDADCALVEVGAKPCGGPETYEPYSKPNVDEARLQELAAAYKKERQDYFKDNQIVGICMMTPKPNVACVNNQCMASEQSLKIQ